MIIMSFFFVKQSDDVFVAILILLNKHVHHRSTGTGRRGWATLGSAIATTARRVASFKRETPSDERRPRVSNALNTCASFIDRTWKLLRGKLEKQIDKIKWSFCGSRFILRFIFKIFQRFVRERDAEINVREITFGVNLRPWCLCLCMCDCKLKSFMV